jgi:hypothetical protein
MVSIGIDPSPLVTFVTLRWWPVVSPLARPTWIRVPARRGPRQRPGVSWPKWSFSTWKNKGNVLKKGKTYSFFHIFYMEMEMWWTIYWNMRTEKEFGKKDGLWHGLTWCLTVLPTQNLWGELFSTCSAILGRSSVGNSEVPKRISDSFFGWDLLVPADLKSKSHVVFVHPSMQKMERKFLFDHLNSSYVTQTTRVVTFKVSDINYILTFDT